MSIFLILAIWANMYVGGGAVIEEKTDTEKQKDGWMDEWINGQNILS